MFIVLLLKNNFINKHNLSNREQGQGTVDELRSRDFRKDLEEREAKPAGKQLPAVVRRAIEQNAAASSNAGGASGATPSKRPKTDQVTATNLDADDPAEDESSSDEDSDDDTAALLEELQKIRRERAHESAKKEIEKKQEEDRIRMENIISGNPLLNYSAAAAAKADMKVKRRWDDDVVFKNCARSEPERKSANFINDSLRSEFHKKFMEKYIK